MIIRRVKLMALKRKCAGSVEVEAGWIGGRRLRMSVYVTQSS